MFHCNGWCFPWAVTAAGGTHVCLRRRRPGRVWRLIREEGVTHLNGAPTVLSMLAYAPDAGPAGRAHGPRRHRGRAAVAGAAAPHERAGLRRHPPVRADRDLRPGDDLRLAPGVGRPATTTQQARTQGPPGRRQHDLAAPSRVIADDGSDVPADGQTVGQIALRGNNVMLGYLPRPGGDARAPPRTAGSAPATSACCIPTATSS